MLYPWKIGVSCASTGGQRPSLFFLKNLNQKTPWIWVSPGEIEVEPMLGVLSISYPLLNLLQINFLTSGWMCGCQMFALPDLAGKNCAPFYVLWRMRRLGAEREWKWQSKYLTDNMVIYVIFRWASSKSIKLWALLLHIKLLEAKLSCFIVVIYLPGDVMIFQDTGELSCGVPMQLLGHYKSNELLSLLWRPALPKTSTLLWALQMLDPVWDPPSSWLRHTDHSDWYRSTMWEQSVL